MQTLKRNTMTGTIEIPGMKEGLVTEVFDHLSQRYSKKEESGSETERILSLPGSGPASFTLSLHQKPTYDILIVENGGRTIFVLQQSKDGHGLSYQLKEEVTGATITDLRKTNAVVQAVTSAMEEVAKK